MKVTKRSISLVVMMVSTPLVADGFRHKITRTLQKPMTYVGVATFVGASQALSVFTGSHLLGYGLTAGAFLGLQLAQVPRWFKLRHQYLELMTQHTSEKDPAKRSSWNDPLYDEKSFINGVEIMREFSQRSIEQKKLMKHSFMAQIAAGNEKAAIQSLDTGMRELSAKLTKLRPYTNFQYIAARAAGLSSPDDLLTSDVLIEQGGDATWKYPLQDNAESDLYSIGLEWNDRYHIPYPVYYTWTYAIATKCVRLLLRRYSLLKAIRKTMGYVVPGQESLGSMNVYISQP